MTRLLWVLVAMIAAGAIGCANARYVQKSGEEGIVAIPRNSDDWPAKNRTKAMELIRNHVGPEFEVVEEKEVQTGHVTTNQENTNREATFNSTVPFLPAEKQTTTTTTTAVPTYEYHIHYRKKLGVPGSSPTSGVTPAGYQGTPTGPQSVSPAAQAGVPIPSVLPR